MKKTGKNLKKHSRRDRLPVILGFLLLYIATMAAATAMVQTKFSDEFDRNLTDKAVLFQKLIASAAEDTAYQKADDKERQLRLCSLLSEHASLVNGLELLGSRYQQIAAAVYDMEGKMLAQSDTMLVNTYTETFQGENGTLDCKTVYRAVPIKEYLTEEELRQLAGFIGEISEAHQDRADIPAPYRLSAFYGEDGIEPVRLCIQKVEWAPFEENGMEESPSQEDALYHCGFSWSVSDGEQNRNYFQVDSQIIWDWVNQDRQEEADTAEPEQIPSLMAMQSFPYIIWGYNDWSSWETNAFLHSFEEKLEEEELLRYRESAVYSGREDMENIENNRRKISCPVAVNKEERYQLVLASEAHPWMAAMDYMKYAYLTVFICLVICLATVLFTMERADRKQALLEERRRDFTNAMAHELKAPLSVIRSFAENLLEHVSPEKEDYYLEHIIGQTREMDELVTELLTVSRLDSAEQIFMGEDLSLTETVREQLRKLTPDIEEKKLQIHWDIKGDFPVRGNRSYLEKAVWNLLDNAVSYNETGGQIWITSEKEYFSIENTGTPIETEKLPYLCDLFYSGDSSRNRQERHAGLGLFLTKKILDMHKLQLQIENSEKGVKITIKQA